MEALYTILTVVAVILVMIGVGMWFMNDDE